MQPVRNSILRGHSTGIAFRFTGLVYIMRDALLLIMFGKVVAVAFKICSSAFENDGFLPGWYSAAGLNASPPFGWIDEPDGCQSLALVCKAEDGRAHWVVWNIPPDLHTVYGKQPRNPVLESGIRQGWNSFGVAGWTGPEKKQSDCRLTFTLMALDTLLELPADTDGEELVRACTDNILATASITCRYC